MRSVARLAVLISGLVAATDPAGADPLDLHDPRPRAVEVVFETSPSEAPGRLDRDYSDAGPAWFEPGPEAGQATLRVPGWVMEQALQSHRPISGSFSDFVWVFDVGSGHVLSARLTGRFLKQLEWGFLSSGVETWTETRLSTRDRGGFLPPRERLGHRVFEFCRDAAGCTEVPPRPYDPFTGYVNAVGSIRARAAGFGTESFSPLGEMVVREVAEEALDVGALD